MVYAIPYVVIAALFCLVASYMPLVGVAAFAILVFGSMVYLKKPVWILLLIIAFIPMDSLSKLSSLGEMLSLTKLLFPPLLAIAVWQTVSDRRSLWNPQPQRVAIAVFVGAILLSSVFMKDTGFGLLSLKKYLSLLLLYWVAILVLSEIRDITHVLYTIIFTCAISSAVGLLGSLAGVETGFSGEWEGVARTGGMSSEDPNTFAMNVLVAYFIAASLLVSRKGFWLRSLLLLCIVTYSLNLVFSFSRSSLVALVLGAVFFFWSRRREFQWKWVILSGLLLAVCIAPFIPAEYIDRIASLSEMGSTTDTSLQRRMAYHVMGFELVLRSPIWGVGPGNFGYFFTSQEFRYIADTFGVARRLHNAYLSVASELGLFGLGSFLFIVGHSFRMANEVIRKARELEMPEHLWNAQALKYALFTFLVGCAFLPAEYSKYLWILFACLSRLTEIFTADAAKKAVPTGSMAGP